MNTTIGADPEVFITMNNRYTGYKGIIPAGLVLNKLRDTGSELTNVEVKDNAGIETEHGVIFADGMSWELNPKPGNHRQVTDNIGSLLSTSLEALSYLTDQTLDLQLKIAPSSDVNTSMIPLWGDPTLTEFGCDRDESIWPRKIEPSDIDAATHGQRYFGGHIHIGLGNNPKDFYRDINNVNRMIALADGILGMTGIIMDYQLGYLAIARRKVYGQPGVYRIQPHGIEYRTISNSWLLSRERCLDILTLAELLPQLFDTDLPDCLLEMEKEILTILISGRAREAIKFLATHVRKYIPHSSNNYKTLRNLEYCVRGTDYRVVFEQGCKRGWHDD